jgi:hypothetical protein
MGLFSVRAVVLLVLFIYCFCNQVQCLKLLGPKLHLNRFVSRLPSLSLPPGIFISNGNNNGY